METFSFRRFLQQQNFFSSFSSTQKEIMPLSRFWFCCNISTGKGPSRKVTRHSVGGREKTRHHGPGNDVSRTHLWCPHNWISLVSFSVALCLRHPGCQNIAIYNTMQGTWVWRLEIAKQNEIKPLKRGFIFPIKMLFNGLFVISTESFGRSYLFVSLISDFSGPLKILFSIPVCDCHQQ